MAILFGWLRGGRADNTTDHTNHSLTDQSLS
jgi:hypothetical protein